MLLILVLLNVAVYLLMAATTSDLSWDADTLLAWGGNLGQLSLHGEPWRLLTAMFLHAGFQHIIGNMGLLAVTGIYVEPRIGSVCAVAIYIICGLAGGVASAFGHPDVVAVGASGAIAGLVGVVTVFYFGGTHQHISGRWLVQVVGINAIYSFAPGVDALAHLGGFAAGLFCGAVLLLFPTRQMRLVDQLVAGTAQKVPTE